MTTATQPVPADVREDDDPDIAHIVCLCSVDIALCGWDVTDEPWTDEVHSDMPTCPLCALMMDAVCPRCGCLPGED